MPFWRLPPFSNTTVICPAYIHIYTYIYIYTVYAQNRKGILVKWCMNMLCAISKLFEKVVCNQLYDYFTKNKLFHDNQYGFRTKHSTELAVTELVDRVLLNVDNKQVPFAVFMDLSKALDTLDHKILIDKLQHYVIRGISLMWLQRYL